MSTRDPRDMWPDDDGGTGQVLGCLAVVGAIIGSVLGAAVGVLTDNAKLKAIDDLLFLVEVPLAAIGFGLLAAFVWNAGVKRATRLGSPIDQLRQPGQAIAAAIALVAPAAIAIFLILVAPWLAPWTALVVVLAMVADPVLRGIKAIWNTVK